MRLRNLSHSNMNEVPLRVALVRQGIGHRVCYLGTSGKENFAVKKGLLWQQRDRMFSRWKERYFILTKDYLACFKKSSKIASSDMGGFIFKLSLVDIDGVQWIDKKEGGIITISSLTEGRFFLRSKSEMDEWLQVIRDTISQSKGRRAALRSSVSRDSIHVESQISETGSLYQSHKIPLQYTYSDCSPDFYRLQGSSTDLIRGSIGLMRIPEDYRSSASSSVADSSRYSILTDSDRRSFDVEDTATPSPPSSSCSTTSRSYMAPPLPLTGGCQPGQPAHPSGVPMGHKRCHSHGRPPPRLQEPIIIYPNDRISPRVDRSYSDAHQLEALARRRIHPDTKQLGNRNEIKRTLSIRPS